jgi:hypothetical protein
MAGEGEKTAGYTLSCVHTGPMRRCPASLFLPLFFSDCLTTVQPQAQNAFRVVATHNL